MEVKINFCGGNHVSGWIDSSILTHLIRDESVESIMDNDNGEMLFIRDYHAILAVREPEEDQTSPDPDTQEHEENHADIVYVINFLTTGDNTRFFRNLDDAVEEMFAFHNFGFMTLSVIDLNSSKTPKFICATRNGSSGERILAEEYELGVEFEEYPPLMDALYRIRPDLF